jgi:hypothetical protein
MKAMTIVFFDIRCVIMIKWVPEGQRVNQKNYLELLTKLRERVRKERPELWKKKSRILHQEKAPAHNVLAVKQFLADKCIPVLEHPPPKSPDLVPCDFLSVPQTEKCVERNSF